MTGIDTMGNTKIIENIHEHTLYDAETSVNIAKAYNNMGRMLIKLGKDIIQLVVSWLSIQ